MPTPHFRYVTANASYQQHLPHGFQVDLTGQGQWAFNTLPVEQEWTLGGFGNLNAWQPAIAVGDSGYLARLEFSAGSPVVYRSEARLGLFLETGGAKPTTPPPGRNLADAVGYWSQPAANLALQFKRDGDGGASDRE